MLPVGYLNPLSCLNGQLAQLDCLLSFAIAAISAPNCYTRPKMSSEGSGVLEFKQLRHPCLELQEDVTFIPNDCYFKKGKRMRCVYRANTLNELNCRRDTHEHHYGSEHGRQKYLHSVGRCGCSNGSSRIVCSLCIR